MGEIIRVVEAAKRLGITKKHLYGLHRADPTFPRIFKLSPKASVLLGEELNAWVAARRAGHRIDGKREGGAA